MNGWMKWGRWGQHQPFLYVIPKFLSFSLTKNHIYHFRVLVFHFSSCFNTVKHVGCETEDADSVEIKRPVTSGEQIFFCSQVLSVCKE